MIARFRKSRRRIFRCLIFAIRISVREIRDSPIIEHSKIPDLLYVTSHQVPGSDVPPKSRVSIAKQQAVDCEVHRLSWLSVLTPRPTVGAPRLSCLLRVVSWIILPLCDRGFFIP